MISTLNQYGQVVGSVERRSYKGVEIWERRVRLQLVHPLPDHHVNICGYDVVVEDISKESDSSEAQSQLVNVNVTRSDMMMTGAVNSSGVTSLLPVTPSTSGNLT